jgi:hypothetical protein
MGVTAVVGAVSENLLPDAHVCYLDRAADALKVPAVDGDHTEMWVRVLLVPPLVHEPVTPLPAERHRGGTLVTWPQVSRRDRIRAVRSVDLTNVDGHGVGIGTGACGIKNRAEKPPIQAFLAG